LTNKAQQSLKGYQSPDKHSLESGLRRNQREKSYSKERSPSNSNENAAKAMQSERQSNNRGRADFLTNLYDSNRKR